MSEKHQDKSKASKIQLRIYVVYLLIASFLFTGVAFSKYITSGDAQDSARVAGIGEIVITETGDFVGQSTDGSKTTNKFIVIPGVNLTKDVRLHFDGSEMACYVFLQVKPEGFTTTDHYQFANGKVSWAIDNSWTYLEADEGAYIFYHIVSANGAIESKAILKNSEVAVSEYLTRSELEALPDLLHISFEATAVQYDGFGDFDTEAEHAHAAWNSVSKH